MKIVDLKGQACPLPIILTKKEISNSQQGDVIEVVLDNEVSKCNLEMYLKEIGVVFTQQSFDQEHRIRFSVGNTDLLQEDQSPACGIKSRKLEDYVIVFGSDQMGRGDTDLGKLLVRSYINALKELDTLPQKILFYNSGVKLLSQQSDTADSLKELYEMGVDIIGCGVCIEYYKIVLGAGRISNMFVIGNSVASALKVIYP